MEGNTRFAIDVYIVEGDNSFEAFVLRLNLCATCPIVRFAVGFNGHLGPAVLDHADALGIKRVW